MKKGISISITGLILFAVLFLFAEEFASGIKTGLLNCSRVIIPSLFPFMAAASLTGKGELPQKLKRIINPFTKFLFGLPSECFFTLVIGQLGGYLAGAKSADSLFESGKLTESEANRLILFCVNAGMGFSVNAVGSAMLNSRESGRILLLSLTLSSLLTGFVSKYFSLKKTEYAHNITRKTSFSEALVGSVNSAAESTFYACGFVTVFSGIAAVIESVTKNKTIGAAISCLLEVTNGCFAASGKVSLPVISAICAFGGVCVHFQIFSIAKNIKINIPLFYAFRIMHAAAAYIICKIILHLFPIEQNVFLSIAENTAVWSYSAPSSLSLLFLSALLILDLDNKEKVW